MATGVSSYPVPALSGSRLDLAPAPWFEAGSIPVPSCGAWFLLPSKVGADYFHTHVTIHSVPEPPCCVGFGFVLCMHTA